MKEKMCPICGKPVRSDALAKKSCKLCGMLIDDSKSQCIYRTNSGKSLYFGCDRCRKSYLEIIEEDPKIVREEKHSVRKD